MMFGDTSRLGRPFSKDPHVITFKGKYLMYYSIPPKENSTEVAGWGIGVAESRNLNKWERVGEITPAAPYEAKDYALLVLSCERILCISFIRRTAMVKRCCLSCLVGRWDKLCP